MHITEPTGVRVDPAVARAVLDREAAQRVVDQAHARKAMADYLATARHPLGRLVARRPAA